MIDGNLVKAKALRLQDKMGLCEKDKLAFSNGWLASFQNRHGFKSFTTFGEVDLSTLHHFQNS
ncbi:hypothetical protein F444_21831 [Phytophthora nicotianae P1976]|uniref:HTH CENPB-type domain-containing protein n=2 Tax=Phytophthora nicotianae TaxID=4792 RepID=A0A080YZU6_PHYNI|nr:hypothetical protein F444_21831 [Phytophthora nicotianae P1976]